MVLVGIFLRFLTYPSSTMIRCPGAYTKNSRTPDVSPRASKTLDEHAQSRPFRGVQRVNRPRHPPDYTLKSMPRPRGPARAPRRPRPTAEPRSHLRPSRSRRCSPARSRSATADPSAPRRRVSRPGSSSDRQRTTAPEACSKPVLGPLGSARRPRNGREHGFQFRVTDESPGDPQPNGELVNVPQRREDAEHEAAGRSWLVSICAPWPVSTRRPKPRADRSCTVLTKWRGCDRGDLQTSTSPLRRARRQLSSPGRSSRTPEARSW